MNILVTGSAGMIGGYVVKGLMEKGYVVVGIDRRTNDNLLVQGFWTSQAAEPSARLVISGGSSSRSGAGRGIC